MTLQTLFLKLALEFVVTNLSLVNTIDSIRAISNDLSFQDHYLVL